MPKGSFSYFFPSKQDLALAVIDEHWENQREQWAGILAEPGSAVDRIHRIFRASTVVQQEALADSGVVAGCLYGNLALELSSTEEVVRVRLQEIFDTQVKMIDRALAEDRRFAGLSDRDRGRLAASVVSQLEGSVLFAKLFQDPTKVEAHWDSTATMLLAASEPSVAAV